jgi:polar amino acid transport system permease protein
MTYVWHWGVLSQYAGVFVSGASVTVVLTGLSIVFGTVLGVCVTLARRSSLPYIPLLARVYTELFQGVPILILLIWIYYVVPLLWGVIVSPFTAALLALTLHLSAYVAETIRGGIDALDRSQYESGVTLGLRPLQVVFLIVLPQAFRSVLPSLLGLYIETLKNSSLASIIAVNELLHNANMVISNTYRPLEVYTGVALVYLALIIPATSFARWAEKRVAQPRNTI